jgi:hypothetical protein
MRKLDSGDLGIMIGAYLSLINDLPPFRGSHYHDRDDLEAVMSKWPIIVDL